MSKFMYKLMTSWHLEITKCCLSIILGVLFFLSLILNSTIGQSLISEISVLKTGPMICALYLPNIPDFEFLWMGQGCKLFCLHVYSTERKRNKLEITDWCKNLGVKHRGFQCYWIKKQKLHFPNQPVERRLFWCWTLDLILTYILLNSQSLNNISI